jgi:hypothetical protein
LEVVWLGKRERGEEIIDNFLPSLINSQCLLI